MDLKEHEDKVVAGIEKWSRLEQIIALRYLPTLLGIKISDTQYELAKEYNKMKEAK